MRKSSVLFLLFAFLLLFDIIFAVHFHRHQREFVEDVGRMNIIVSELGLSDLALTSEARYTRHPAVSDPVAPYMDHPLDFEHFPSGSFWRPVK